VARRRPFVGRVLRLWREISKNKDGRVLPLSGELLKIIERAKALRRLDCPYVFHLGGEQIGDCFGEGQTS
jgi:hypothetical protein